MWKKGEHQQVDPSVLSLFWIPPAYCQLHINSFDKCFATKNTRMCLKKRCEQIEPFSEWKLSLIIPFLSGQLRQWNYQFCRLVQTIFTCSLCCEAIPSLFVEKGGEGFWPIFIRLAEWKWYERVSESIKGSKVWVSWLAASWLGAIW